MTFKYVTLSRQNMYNIMCRICMSNPPVGQRCHSYCASSSPPDQRSLLSEQREGKQESRNGEI